MSQVFHSSNKAGYISALTDMGFARIDYLALLNSGSFYQAENTRDNNPKIWFRMNPARMADFILTSSGVTKACTLLSKMLKQFFPSNLKNTDYRGRDESYFFKIGSSYLNDCGHQRETSESVSELYGKIDSNGILHLAAFIGDAQNPVYTVHKENYSVLWTGLHGLFATFTEDMVPLSFRNLHRGHGPFATFTEG